MSQTVSAFVRRCEIKSTYIHMCRFWWKGFFSRWPQQRKTIFFRTLMNIFSLFLLFAEEKEASGENSTPNETKHRKSSQLKTKSLHSLHKKRKRHRTAFTPTQLMGLENSFERGHYLVGDERRQLAQFLRLSETQIKVPMFIWLNTVGVRF